MGLTWEEVEASAQDRQTWRQRVALCIGDAGSIKSRHHRENRTSAMHSVVAEVLFIIIITPMPVYLAKHIFAYLLMRSCFLSHDTESSVTQIQKQNFI